MGKRTWEPTIVEDLAFIPLTRGKWAIVDLADLALVRNRTWHCTAKVRRWAHYAVASDGARMHQVVYGDPGPGHEVDHINGNGLDNRRCNLRPVTRTQNLANQHPQAGGTSKYKGVYWAADRQRWIAVIGSYPTKEHLGTFHDEQAAARAYDAAALRRWGEFARVNLPGSLTHEHPTT